MPFDAGWVFRAMSGLALGLALSACQGRGRPLAGGQRDAATRPLASNAPDAAPPTPAPRGKQLTIVYSSNLLGEYEPCGCPVHPLGGLARRASEIDRARADADGLIVVDAGDLFLPTAAVPPGWLPPDPGEVARRGRLLVTGLARSGLTAFTPGERDLAIGLPTLRRLLREAKIPAVSANLVDRAGRPLFDADRLVAVAGLKVGLFGVSKPLPEQAALWQAWGVTAQDPVAAARAAVDALRARGADLIIALIHVGPPDVTRALLREVPGIDWAVAGHSEMNLESPEDAGTARLVEAMSMGKHLGRLDLHVVDGTGRFVDRGQRAQLVAILADHQRQLDDYRKRVNQAVDGSTTTPTSYYQQRIKDLEASVARETALLAATPATVTGSWFENRILPLDTSIADHTGVAPLVAAYNQENSRRATAGKPVGIAARDPRLTPAAPRLGAPPAQVAATPPQAAASPLQYAGSVACGGCHQEALQFWRTTKHARALDTLKKKKRDRDPTCIACHVTGFMRPGGTTDIALVTGRLRDVGCESCHGPGLAHSAAPGAATMKATVAASVCLGCHTPDQTNGDFDYPLFRQAVLGPGHGK